MSNCSYTAFSAPQPIRGQINWANGHRPTPLSYARFVNGEERQAESIELDGVVYAPVRECELEYHETGWVSCRECNTSWKNDRPHVYRRCPNCGARVRGGGDD